MFDESSQKLIDEVVATYWHNGSIRKTAMEMGIEHAKVRKLLITHGSYETPFSNEVFFLRCKGYSVEEIAQELGTTTKRVSAWLPYEKSVYNAPDRSSDAIRSSNYRQRIEQAQINQVKARLESTTHGRAVPKQPPDDDVLMPINSENAVEPIGEPIRLHLSLTNENLSEDDQAVLRRFGRSSTGYSIERDILIPHDITLHSLHYAIQRLYGWQNSHLHCYKLPEDVYRRLTGGTVKGWGSLIGVLFQTVYPHDAWEERYGDDDYESGSFKSWLKKKYTGPYRYLGEYELYDRAVQEFKDFLNFRPTIDVHEPFSFERKERKIIKTAPIIELTLAELNASLVIDDGTEDLLERLPVSSILVPDGMKTASANELNRNKIKRYYNGYGEVEEPEVKPITNKLLYHYDYGDGWIVEITRLESCDDLLRKNILTYLYLNWKTGHPL